MKIWRDGSHIYTIGKRKKDPKTAAFLIIKILKRLNIDLNDWLAKLTKSKS